MTSHCQDYGEGKLKKVEDKMEEVYISTDESEIKARLEHRYYKNLQGQLEIQNLSIEKGENIRKINKLKFNPMSCIRTNNHQNSDKVNSFLEKLEKEGFYVVRGNK